jgi:hypothetical protein
MTTGAQRRGIRRVMASRGGTIRSIRIDVAAASLGKQTMLETQPWKPSCCA